MQSLCNFKRGCDAMQCNCLSMFFAILNAKLMFSLSFTFSINCLVVYFHYKHLIFSSFLFFRKNYLLLSCAMSVRPSVCPSVCPSICPSVRPSVEIISFRDISISNRPIDLKMSMNVRKGVVHVRKA